jgi:3-hydroxy-9,10-secoandrosta-1,3,5(10)-triene-9,17-dione monooxygenase
MSLTEVRPTTADESPAPTRDELLDRVRAIGPLVREQARAGDARRGLTDEVVEAIKSAGLFRILQPRRWGGMELDLATFYLVQLELSKYDMSAGWVHGVVGVHAWQAGIFDDRAARDIWGADPSVLIASSYMPAAKLTAVEGGFRASGRWRFSSGCQHADWFFLGGLLAPDEEGQVRPGTLLFPKTDVKILDTWDVAGLQGTGSHDVVVEDAFVPDYRIHRHIDGFRCASPGNAVNTGWLYRVPFFQAFLRAVSTASIGTLSAMTDAFIDYGSGKVGAFGGKTREDPVAQLAVAEARAAVDEMTALMLRNMQRLRECAERREIPPIEERLLYKLQASEVANRCAILGARLYRCTGGSGAFNDHPFARMLANLNVGRQHVVNQYEQWGANYGACLMGRGNEDLAL